MRGTTRANVVQVPDLYELMNDEMGIAFDSEDRSLAKRLYLIPNSHKRCNRTPFLNGYDEQSSMDFTDVDIAVAISYFEAEYAKEISVLEAHCDGVRVRWGAHAWTSC